MIQILQEFDPGIISINVDNANEKFRRGNVYKILSKNHSKALPLNVYGDGMKKALLLMSAVIKTKGGILLLDEFETAIHTTAMDTTFKWILETCVRLDVQLFLTTHSEEAIDKVLKCSPELQDKIKVFTLYKNDKETVVCALTAHKAIEIKDEMGLELQLMNSILICRRFHGFCIASIFYAAEYSNGKMTDGAGIFCVLQENQKKEIII